LLAYFLTSTTGIKCEEMKPLSNLQISVSKNCLVYCKQIWRARNIWWIHNTPTVVTLQHNFNVMIV